MPHESFLSAEKMMEYFRMIDSELKERDLHGEILLTGGASMCLVYNARGMTRDIDALYEPKSIINQIVRDIAIREGIEEDWLNDGVKGFLEPIMGEKRISVTSFPNLDVFSVSGEALLAMKLTAARAGSMDSEDCLFLIKELNIHNVNEAMEIVNEYAPRRADLRTKLFAETLLSQMNSPRGKTGKKLQNPER